MKTVPGHSGGDGTDVFGDAFKVKAVVGIINIDAVCNAGQTARAACAGAEKSLEAAVLIHDHIIPRNAALTAKDRAQKHRDILRCFLWACLRLLYDSAEAASRAGVRLDAAQPMQYNGEQKGGNGNV